MERSVLLDLFGCLVINDISTHDWQPYYQLITISQTILSNIDTRYSRFVIHTQAERSLKFKLSSFRGNIMEIKKNINLNIKKTVENSVSGNDEFHFFVDELTSADYMPTYAGKADEKYEFNEMGDEFFEFLARKANEDGIYIRLVYATASETDGEAVFELEYGGAKDEYRTRDIDDVLAFEFADFGIKVKGSEVTFGATIEGGCGHTPYFAEFGSNKASEKFISLENPLNKRIISIMEEMIYD